MMDQPRVATPAERAFIVWTTIGGHALVLVLLATAIVRSSATLVAFALTGLLSWWAGFIVAVMVVHTRPQ